MKTTVKAVLVVLAIAMLASCNFFWTYETATGTGGTITSGTTTEFSTTVTTTGTAMKDFSAVTIKDLYHNYAGSLRIELQSPKGTKVVLSGNVGSYNDFNGDYRFIPTSISSDDPTPSIKDYSAPNYVISEGSYVADGDLATFIGEDPNGTWKLIITQNADYYSYTGTFASFDLEYAF